jgi:hypothetical protein
MRLNKALFEGNITPGSKSFFTVLLLSLLSDFGYYRGFTVTCVVLGELTCPLESVTVNENVNNVCAVTLVGAMKVGVTVFAPFNDTAGPAVWVEL